MKLNPTPTEASLADERDFNYVVTLNKKHTWELGWLPFDCLRNTINAGRVILGKCNGENAGFLLHGVVRDRVRIYQHCIQLDARHMLHGLRILSGLVVLAGLAETNLISLHCRDGLASNAFWASAGFTPGGIIPGGRTAGRMLFEWWLNVPAAILDTRFPHGVAFAAACTALATKHAVDSGLLRQGELPQIRSRQDHTLAVQAAVAAASDATASATSESLSGLLAEPGKLAKYDAGMVGNGEILRRVAGCFARVSDNAQVANRTIKPPSQATAADFGIASTEPAYMKRGNPIQIAH